MNYHRSPYLPLLILSTVMALWIAVRSFQRRPARGARSLALFMLLAAIWSSGYALELSGADLATKLFWAKEQYLAILFLPIVWLTFASRHTHRDQWLNTRSLILLSIIPTISLILIWTNESHHLVWRQVTFDPQDLDAPLKWSYGQGFWVFIVGYSYLLLLIGTTLLFRDLLKTAPLYRGQITVLLIGLLTPWVNSVLYVLDRSPFPELDLTPFSFIVSGLAYGWGISRLQLIDLVPMSGTTLFENFPDGILLLDSQNRIVNLNASAERLLGHRFAQLIGKPCQQALADFPEIASHCEEEGTRLIQLPNPLQSDQSFPVDLRTQPMFDKRGHTIGRVIFLRRMSDDEQTQRALFATEARYQSLVEQAPAVIYLDTYHQPYQGVYINPQVEALLGYPPKEFLDDQGLWERLVHPDDLERYLAAEDVHRRTGQPLKIDYRMIDRQGQFKWIHDESQILYDEAGNPKYSHGFIIDVTQRRQTEEELRKLREAVDNSQEAIYTADRDGVITFVNAAFTQLFGYTASEVVGKETPRILQSGITDQEIYAAFWKRLRAKETFHGEFTNRTKDGRLVEIRGSINPILNEEGEITGFLAIQRDVTERKRMELALQESEDRYRDLVEHSHDMMATHDLDGNILTINASAANKLGYPLEEIIGANLRDFISPDFLHEVDIYLKIIRRRNRARGLMRLMTKAGEEQIWEFDNTVRTEGVAEPIVRGIAHDVTARVRAEENLNRRLQELTVLHAVSKAGVECTGEDELIERATQIIGDALYPHNFGVLLFDESQGVLQLHPSYRVADEVKNMRIPLGEGITGWVAQKREPRRVVDARDDPDFIQIASGLRSELCVPILFGDQLIGVLNAESEKVGAFTEDDERLLTTFAGQLAVAIENIRREEAVHKQADLSASLYRLSSDLAAVLDEKEVCQRVVEGLNATLGYEHVGLLLIEPATGDRILAAQVGLPPVPYNQRLTGTRELSARPIQDRKLHYTADVSRDPQYVSGLDTGSEVDVPVQAGGKLIGVLFVENTQVAAFTEDDFVVLAAAANLAAVAIERARLFAEVQYLAITDAVTELYNRHYFFRQGEYEFGRARRYRRDISAIMVDIDHFKQVNDQYGHAIGDQVLHEVARRLKSKTRESDLLARYGGEEFVILLPETGEKKAHQLAKRLQRIIFDQPIRTERGDVELTISVGVAFASADIASLSKLLDCADSGLYRAKQTGRNKVVVYRPSP